MSKAEWASNTRPSMPVPPRTARMVRMGGFVFTPNGLAHDLSEDDVERLIQSPYIPPDAPGRVTL